jgi:hypothetical protein
LNNAGIELSLTADGGVTLGTNTPLHLKRPRTVSSRSIICCKRALILASLDKVVENTSSTTPNQIKNPPLYFFLPVENAHIKIIIDTLLQVT